MQRLYFVRHGESELNARRTFAGQIDTPLTTLGTQQAQLAAIHAKPLGINLIVSSPLVRARTTAEIIATAINYPLDHIVINDLLKERSLGSLEGKSWDEFEEDETIFPDIETHEQLLARAKQALAYVQSLAADIVLIASHGSFARALQTAIDPTQEYAEPENAQIVQLI